MLWLEAAALLTAAKWTHATLMICVSRNDSMQRAARPAYTSDIFSIYLQVAAAGAQNFIRARVPVPSNLNLKQWRELAKAAHDHQVVDFLTFCFLAGFDGEVPIPSYQP